MNCKRSKNSISCDLSTNDQSLTAGTAGNGHWVEDLFPPTFRLLVNELIDGSLTATVCQSDGLELSKMSLQRFTQDRFAQLTKSISPLDIEPLKNVYHRVWLMMKNKQDEPDTAIIGQPDSHASQQSADIAQSVSKLDLLEGTSACQETESPVANTHCVWDSSEIEVIRKVLRAMSDENAQLHGQVSVLEHDVKILTEVRYKHRKAIQHLQVQLHEVSSASQRLQMLVEHLKADLDYSAKELAAQQCIQTECSKLAAEVQQLKQQLSTSTTQQLQVVAAVEAKCMSMLEEQKLAETITKAGVTRDVTKLIDQVDQLQQQLDKEKQDHTRTRRALQHLQTHFSSLSAASEKVQTRHNQLIIWSYN